MDSAGASAFSMEDPFAQFMQQLCTTLVNSPAPVSHASPMVNPSLFSGSEEECGGFILQCQLVLETYLHQRTIPASLW